jgi:hypothetical protein
MDKIWGPCKYAQMSLRTLLYGSLVLCGAVAWLVLVVRVAILVRREVRSQQVVVQAYNNKRFHIILRIHAI